MKQNLMNVYTKLDWLVALFIFMFPITFLTIRHGVHVSLFALFFIAIYQFWRDGKKTCQYEYPQDFLVFSIFLGLFLAVFISQIFRGSIYPAAFDGPFRILIAGIVFILLKQFNISYIKILRIAIPLGLICIFISIKIHPSAYWDGRFATYFVDPNTLGSQVFIMGIISILMININRNRAKTLFFLQVLGFILAMYISIGSGSRGAWLVGPFILLLMLILRVGDIKLAANSNKGRMWIDTLVICIFVVSAAVLSFSFSATLSERIVSGYYEIKNWFSGENLWTSAGTRLSIWKFSLQFANESLFFGYGEEKNMMQVLENSPLNIPENETAINTMALTGPHSDILSKLLSSGVFGLFGYICVLMAPFIIFWRHRNAVNLDIKMASRVGLYYIIGVFIAGLSNEQLSLKYLCTFYGLMIATLLAQVLHKPSDLGQTQTPRIT